MPWRLAGQQVWVRVAGDEIVVSHVGDGEPTEVARHQRTTPGNPRLDDAHFPAQPEGPLARTAVAGNDAEAAFLALGDGAVLWLKEAAHSGVARLRAKMADAVTLAKLGDPAAVNWALGHAAVMGRFGDGDLAAIIAHRAQTAAGPLRRASEDHSLQPGTAAWQEFGQ